jgi:hypothetical protein
MDWRLQFERRPIKRLPWLHHRAQGRDGDVTRGAAFAGEGFGLRIVDMAGIQVCVVGGMRADGGDSAGALDAAPARVLCSSKRKAKEVEEVGDDG